MNLKIASVLAILVTIALPVAACAPSAKGFPSMPAVAVFNAASTVLAGIEVTGNDTYVIQNGHYFLNDSITVEENGTLIIRDAVLDFNGTSSFLNTNDNATVLMSNVTVNNAGGYSYSYIRDKSSLTATADIFVGNSYFYFYDTCRASFEGSKAYRISANNNATIQVSNTTLQYFYCYGFSVATISGSILYYLYVQDSSSAFVVDSVVSDKITLEFERDSIVSLSVPEGMVNRWSLYGNATVTKAYINLTLVNTKVSLWTLNCYDTSVVAVAASNLDVINAYDNTSILLANSRVGYVYMYEFCNVTLADSVVTGRVSLTFSEDSNAALSLPIGQFPHWNLYVDNVVSPASLNLTLQNVSVAGWDASCYSSTVSLSDSDVEYLSGYDNSTITIADSMVHGIYGYGHSLFTIASADIDWTYMYDTSEINVQDSTVDGVYAYGNSSVSVNHSRTDYLGVYDFASLALVDSFTKYYVTMSFIEDTQVVLPSLPSGNVEHWNLYENASVTKAYINLTFVNTKIRGWGDINTKDEASVTVEDCFIGYVYAYDLSSVTLLDSAADYIYVYNNSTLSMTNSSVNCVQLEPESDSEISFNSLPTGYVDYWSLHSNASIGKAYFGCKIIASWIGQWGFTAHDFTSLSFWHCILNSVYVYDSSILLMDNCTVNTVGSYSTSKVSLVNTIVLNNAYAYDDSVWTVTDSDFQSRLYIKFKADSEVYGLSFPTGLIGHWSLNEGADVKHVFLNLTISNSRVKAWGIYTYGSSMISIMNSNVEYLAAYDLSNITIENCTLETVYVYKLSQLHLSGVPSWQSVAVNLNTYSMSATTLTESRVAIVTAYAYSTVDLVATEFGTARVYDKAQVRVIRSLEVHVIDFNGQNIVSANVTVRDQGGVFADSKLTNRDGEARFNLPARTIDALGSHPIGSYNVTGASAGYTTGKVIDMAENREVTIVLSYIVSEFSVSLLMFALTTTTIIAVLVKKRFARNNAAPDTNGF